jgi:hypothetical protein
MVCLTSQKWKSSNIVIWFLTVGRAETTKLTLIRARVLPNFQSPFFRKKKKLSESFDAQELSCGTA